MAELIPIDDLGAGIVKKDDDETKRLKSGQLSLMLQHKFGSRLRFNLLTKDIEVDNQRLPQPEFELKHVALSERGWDIGEKACQDAISYAAQVHSYNPILDYLEWLTKSDVEPFDLDHVASYLIGTNDPLYDAMMKATLIGAVSRIFEPGCKVDTCCVIKGQQGIRKSTFWESLASPDWFCSTHQDQEKDWVMAVHRCWIYEEQELEYTVGRIAAGKMKGRLSRTSDTCRYPYATNIDDHPRQSIIVATVNDDQFLKDATGNRRFWVIDCPHNPKIGEVIDTAAVVENRDAIWKAAVLAYRSGRLPLLSREQQNESDARNGSYELENPYDAPLLRWFQRRRRLDEPKWFTIDQAMEQAGTNPNQKKVTDSLNRLGCKRHQQRMDGKRLRVWLMPDSPGTAAGGSAGTGQNGCQ
jgi:predicted P-loop ATPase